MQLPQQLPVVLVHGGLFDDMTPEEFWVDSGVVAAVRAGGNEVLAPQRPPRPRSWAEESQAIADAIETAGFDQVALVGASHGCAAAARFAVDRPHKVARLMLAWPATAGDQVTDGLARVVIEDLFDASTADGLLAGETLWAVTDEELAASTMALVVHPSMPANHTHQRETATRLLQLRPDGYLSGGGPEPLDEQFDEYRDEFVRLVNVIARVEHDD